MAKFTGCHRSTGAAFAKAFAFTMTATGKTLRQEIILMRIAKKLGGLLRNCLNLVESVGLGIDRVTERCG